LIYTALKAVSLEDVFILAHTCQVCQEVFSIFLKYFFEVLKASVITGVLNWWRILAGDIRLLQIGSAASAWKLWKL